MLFATLQTRAAVYNARACSWSAAALLAPIHAASAAASTQLRPVDPALPCGRLRSGPSRAEAPWLARPVLWPERRRHSAAARERLRHAVRALGAGGQLQHHAALAESAHVHHHSA